MLKLLSEDLRTNIEILMESGEIDRAHEAVKEVMSKIESHKKDLESKLELGGDVDEREVIFSGTVLEFFRRFDSMLDEDTDDMTLDSKKEVKSKEKVEKAKPKMTKTKLKVVKEKSLDKEFKSGDSVFDMSLYDELMQDIDEGNWVKATDMILAPVTVDDMLKLLSEDLRTNIEILMESGEIDRAHEAVKEVMSKIESHKKDLESKLELGGDVDEREVIFSGTVLEFFRRFDSMLDEDTDDMTLDSKKEVKSKEKVEKAKPKMTKTKLKVVKEKSLDKELKSDEIF